MKQRKLGTEGLSVSSVGLGCMGMSDLYGSSSQQDSMRVLEKAIELGVHFWDTADIYGPYQNEQLLGQFFQQHPGSRDKITLATKFGIMRSDAGEFLGVNGHPEYVKQACDASLQRLDVETIDVYYQHRMDPSVPIEDTVGAMADLVQAGKIKYIGLSEAGAETLERAQAVHPISVLQSEYSMWTRGLEDKILPVCRTLGIGLVAYSPLGRGFLTGMFKSREDLEESDWRLAAPRFAEEHFQQNLKLVEHLTELADAKQCTAAQLALAWLAHQGDDIVPIPGTRSTARLQENAQSVSISLDDDELQSINDMLDKIDILGTRYPEAMMGGLEV
ncbi:MAG: aldo/keto reductase [Pseudomonadales bacterium]|nr:aldo/keto reductase [Pseudomonadales bacterium]